MAPLLQHISKSTRRYFVYNEPPDDGRSEVVFGGVEKANLHSCAEIFTFVLPQIESV